MANKKRTCYTFRHARARFTSPSNFGTCDDDAGRACGAADELGPAKRDGGQAGISHGVFTLPHGQRSRADCAIDSGVGADLERSVEQTLEALCEVWEQRVRPRCARRNEIN